MVKVIAHKVENIWLVFAPHVFKMYFSCSVSQLLFSLARDFSVSKEIVLGHFYLELSLFPLSLVINTANLLAHLT